MTPASRTGSAVLAMAALGDFVAPYQLARPAGLTTGNFGRHGNHLNNRKLWRRMKAHTHHTSPNKSRRAVAWRGRKRGSRS